MSTEELGRVFHHNISKGKNIVSFIKILALYFWFVIVKASKWSMEQCGCFLKAAHDVEVAAACRRSFINERIIGHRHLRLLWFVRHIFQNCPLYVFCVFYKYQIHWNYRNIDWKCDAVRTILHHFLSNFPFSRGEWKVEQETEEEESGQYRRSSRK